MRGRSLRPPEHLRHLDETKPIDTVRDRAADRPPEGHDRDELEQVDQAGEQARFRQQVDVVEVDGQRSAGADLGERDGGEVQQKAAISEGLSVSATLFPLLGPRSGVGTLVQPCGGANGRARMHVCRVSAPCPDSMWRHSMDGEVVVQRVGSSALLRSRRRVPRSCVRRRR